MTSALDGFAGHMLCIVDISEPSQPREVSRWWWPGQHGAEGETPAYGFCMHGPAYVEGDKAYLSYGRVGRVILDVSNVFEPRLISRICPVSLLERRACPNLPLIMENAVSMLLRLW